MVHYRVSTAGWAKIGGGREAEKNRQPGESRGPKDFAKPGVRLLSE
jgi:hypothetical protein